MHAVEAREAAPGGAGGGAGTGLKRGGSGDLSFQFLFNGALPAEDVPGAALPLWQPSPKLEPGAGAPDQRRTGERSRTLSCSELQGSGGSSGDTAPPAAPAQVRSAARRRCAPW